MPAALRGPARDGREDLLGMKWVTGFPTNASLGVAAIHALVLLSDARTGVPRAILDGGALTAHRTAAVSGAALARWAPPVEGRPTEVALVGAGVQARSHLPVLAHLLPGSRVTICDLDAGRAESLADDVATGRSGLGAFREVGATTDPAEAVEGADVVVTLVSFGPQRQAIAAEAFGPSSTIVAVDYDMCVPASVAERADLFLTDERDQFLATRSASVFAAYPDPHVTLGEAISADTPRPPGRVLVTHLGVGLADVVFGDAILREAESRDIGTILPR